MAVKKRSRKRVRKKEKPWKPRVSPGQQKFLFELQEKLRKVVEERKTETSSASTQSEEKTSKTSSTSIIAPPPIASAAKRFNGRGTSNRHKALAILHNQMVALEVRFQGDLFRLEERYARDIHGPLQALRKVLLAKKSGSSAATCEELLNECKPCFSDGCRQFSELEMHVCCLRNEEKCTTSCDEFWLVALLHSDAILRKKIQSWDVEILRYLADVRVLPVPVNRDRPLASECAGDSCNEAVVGFELVFEFRPNPHFANSALTKRYVIDTLPERNDYVIAPHYDVASTDLSEEWDADSEDSEIESSRRQSRKDCDVDKLLDYKGPQVIAIKGCQIHWITPGCSPRVFSKTTIDWQTTERLSATSPGLSSGPKHMMCSTASSKSTRNCSSKICSTWSCSSRSPRKSHSSVPDTSLAPMFSTSSKARCTPPSGQHVACGKTSDSMTSSPSDSQKSGPSGCRHLSSSGSGPSGCRHLSSSGSGPSGCRHLPSSGNGPSGCRHLSSSGSGPSGCRHLSSGSISNGFSSLSRFDSNLHSSNTMSGTESNRRSFFDFFHVTWTDESDTHSHSEVSKDYQLASYIRDVFIPRAYLLYRRDVMQEPGIGCKHVFAPRNVKYEKETEINSDTIKCTNNYDEIDDDIPMEISKKALRTIQSCDSVKSEIFRHNKEMADHMARSAFGEMLRRHGPGPSTGSTPTPSGDCDVDDVVVRHGSSQTEVDTSSTETNTSQSQDTRYVTSSHSASNSATSDGCRDHKVVRVVRELESEISGGTESVSNWGHQADDELGGSCSFSRAFDSSCPKTGPKTNLSSAPQITSESVFSPLQVSSEEVGFRKVSPHPSYGGPDDSGPPSGPSSVPVYHFSSSDEDELMRQRTPSSSEEEQSDTEALRLLKQNGRSSQGGNILEKNYDCDSEAPPTPTTENSCKQQ